MSDNIVAESMEDDPIRTIEKFQEMKDAGQFDRSVWRKMLNKIRGKKNWTDIEKEAFRPLTAYLSRKDYYSASLLAKTVLSNSPLEFEKIAENSVLNMLDEDKDKSANLKEAFSYLDSFDYTKRIDEIERDSKYIEDEGPDRLIDRVATDIWKELDGSAKVFFAKYVEEDSEALLVPKEGKTPKTGFYNREASDLYEEVIKDDPRDAMNIAKRFDLEQEKIELAREKFRLQEAFQKVEEGNVLDLDPEDISVLEVEDLSEYDKGSRFNKEIGNFLTDVYLWRTNPEDAQRAGEENLIDRINLQREGRRSGNPSEEMKKNIFSEFLDNNEFYTASKYAATADLSVEEDVERAVVDHLGDEDYKRAFAALDSFNYDNKGESILEEVEFYSPEETTSRIIDKVASEIWRELEGSARAFFQMYIDMPEERPENSFRDRTIAKTYIPGSNTPRKGDFYRHDAFYAYEQSLKEGNIKKAENISTRFGTSFE